MQKILIVDDDLSLLEVLSMLFEGEGFSVIPATNGPDALTRAKKLLPNITGS